MEAFEGFFAVQKKQSTELTYADEYPVHTMCFYQEQ
jgi:hypothetical protein